VSCKMSSHAYGTASVLFAAAMSGVGAVEVVVISPPSSFSKFCCADAVWYFLLHHVLACGDWYTMQVSYNAAFCIAGLFDSSIKHVWQASTVSTFGQTLRWV